MDTINIDIRLRPIRFGFLVKPSDSVKLRAIFETNTCLWGGKYNPIIPYLSRVPKWWERQGFRFDNAKQIMNGYLDYFEPDFLVEASEGLAAELGFEQSRVIGLPSVLRRQGGGHQRGIGLDVLDVYRKLYREEFQFVRRHPERVIDVSAKKPFSDFSACLFGAFPRDAELSRYQSTFVTAFDPERIELDASTFEALCRSGAGERRAHSALAMGMSEIDIDFSARNEPILFVLDASEPKDLIDFWNLRAVRRDVLPVPTQWLPPMSGFLK